jgi:hypothetical protein
MSFQQGQAEQQNKHLHKWPPEYTPQFFNIGHVVYAGFIIYVVFALRPFPN